MFARFGIAQVYDVLEAVRMDSGTSIKQLKVDGGATVNNLLMQFQADMLQTEVARPRIVEITALGVEYAAGFAIGTYKVCSTNTMLFTPLQ